MTLTDTTILNQVPSFVFWKDLNSVFLGCNDAFAKIAGLQSPKDIVGKTDFDLIWADACGALYQESDRKVLDGEIQTPFFETQLQANGRILINIVNKVPLYDNDGQMVGIIGSYAEYLTSVTTDVLVQKLKCYQLSNREAECATLLVSGMTFKSIANELNLSHRTVEHYIENIRNKMNVANKSELLIKLMETISSS